MVNAHLKKTLSIINNQGDANKPISYTSKWLKTFFAYVNYLLLCKTITPKVSNLKQ